MSAELIIALDVPSSSDIPPLLDRLPDEVSWFKVGLELFSAEGPAVLAPLQDRGKKIFLDLKLHDIPRTVARTVAAVAHHNVDLLTVHATGGREMLRAAAEAAASAEKGPRLIAVTTLTSLDQSDLDSLGVTRGLGEHALALADLALGAGANGLVCSPHEAASLREHIGTVPLLVTPGIRPAGGVAADQKRVATPAMAVKAGASFLVVGRPILEAADPAEASRSILSEMRDAQV